jgi:predicted lipase
VLCLQVRLVSFASPRLGNATFVDTFHELGIAALRIENKGDVVPDVPGELVNVWVRIQPFQIMQPLLNHHKLIRLR